MKDLMGMMKQVQQMQARMQQMQEELSAMEVAGQSGAGLVSVTLNGKGEMRRIRIDPSLMKPDEVEIVEDLILAASQDAKAKVEAAMQEKMQEVTGGLPAARPEAVLTRRRWGLPIPSRRMMAAPSTSLRRLAPSLATPFGRNVATKAHMSKKSAGPEIERLVQLLARLPGLGPRSARKAALTLLKRRNDLLVPLAEALTAAVDKIVECPTCGNVDTVSPCTICQDTRRDRPDRRRRGDRRPVGAGARRRGQRPVSRARRAPVAAGRHRPGPAQHRPPGRARRPAGEGGSARAQRHGGRPVDGALSLRAARCRGVVVSRLAQGVPVGGELDDPTKAR